jgi:alcohol dehydrogenase
MGFQYVQACPVLFGEGTAKEVGLKIKDLGSDRVLIVCDQNVKALGIVAKVVDGFKSTGISTFEFDKVEPDPSDTVINEGGQFAREIQANGIVGIGGGSVLDAAKAIKVLVSNPGAINRYMDGALPSDIHTPLILVPTTSGTGSEVTMVAVITDTKRKKKLGVPSVATLSVVDPELLYDMSPRITAETGMDALAHAAESYTCNQSHMHSEILALAAMKKLIKYLPLAVAEGTNVKARREVALASNIAGIAFNESFVHVGHAMAHGLGMVYHVSHGAGCALELPVALEFVAKAVPDRVEDIGEIFGVKFKGDESSEQVGVATGDALRRFIKKIGILSLKERGIVKDRLPECIDYAMDDFLVGYTPCKVEKNDVVQMYRDIFDKYQ